MLGLYPVTCTPSLTGHSQVEAMASGVLLDSSHDEKKRKLQESSLLSMDMDVDHASKRPCLATGSDGQVGMARQNQNPSQWQGPAFDWEEVHRQADEAESPLEQVKRVDFPKTLRRAESEPVFDTGPPRGKPWASSFGKTNPQLTGMGKPNPQLSGMVKGSNPLWGSAKPVRQPVIIQPMTSAPLFPPTATSGHTPPSPDSNTSSRLSKRSFAEDDGATASGAGVSGLSHEGPPGKMTAGTPLRPAPKHRRILEEVNSSSEDEGDGDVEPQTKSVLAEQFPKGGAGASRNQGGGARSADSGRLLQSSAQNAPLHDGGLFAGGRRQVFPPLPGMMKRSTSRADLTEEKRPATPSGGGVPLFERLTRGLPPAGERSGESVGSERSEGGRSTKDKEELRRKELDSVHPALRRSMFPLRSESGLSGLGTSDRRAPVSNLSGGVGIENVVKQGSAGASFRPRPPMGRSGVHSTGIETLGAAKFVLPNGVKVTKAASDSLVPGPTLTDEAMRERTLNSVSITSAQGRKQTVEDEFEAYFAMMGISM
ncbi:hypothetical protein KFL_004680090 [Klebsormidium nitens]|uniref:Uncharacterized protein n=1 Tax=Klebsormidium nitens TaxID=105231 RepID=A0A1Y1ID70_KLENI|nr:hypothetical protein KFL_004680090 [Klebsormidium nitens]|eukprot:GAQ88905.1 hypothetical protein KFL_004680090 [Klebsormidium nitens]